MTALGVILGTAAYMAPEQAKGARRQAQRHLAFGCALFEMLTGRRAFDGDDVSDTLAAILRAEPDWSALPQSLPSTVRLVLTKCLAKDRRERFADITTPLFLLTEPALSGVQSESPLRPERRRFHPSLLAAVALAATVATAAVAWRLRPSPPRAPVARFSISIAQDERITNSDRQQIAVSHDGSMIAYVVNQSLYLRRLADPAARALATPAGAITSPVFSPDGQSIAFWSAADRAIERVRTAGGSPLTIAKNETNPFGLSWTDDHLFIGRGPDGIERASTNGESSTVPSRSKAMNQRTVRNCCPMATSCCSRSRPKLAPLPGKGAGGHPVVEDRRAHHDPRGRIGRSLPGRGCSAVRTSGRHHGRSL